MTHLRRAARAAGAAVLLMSIANSADAQARVRGVAGFGLEMGGEKVLQFQYEDGSTPDVPAGAGLLLSGGVVASMYESARHALEGQLTVGLKYRTIPPATNQEATWLRFPVEALVLYRNANGLRLGGGTTMHLRNVLEASGAVVNGRVAFKSTPGLVLQAEYLRRNLGFQARYTALTYEVEEGGSGEVDASSFGIGMNFYFGDRRKTTP